MFGFVKKYIGLNLFGFIRNNKLILLLLVFSMPLCAFDDVDFDHSNGFDLMKEFSIEYIEPSSDLKIKLLRENYKKLKPSNALPSSNPIIPKIIHQIWIGKDSIPKDYKYYTETWRKLHPDWQLIIWDEKSLLKEKFSSEDLYFSARSYAERTDLMRYEILKRYGGLYVDMDVECYKTFEQLPYKYDFFANLEPPAINKKRVTIQNAMIGSVANHPIIIDTLLKIRQNWHKNEEVFEQKFSSSFRSFARSNHNLAVHRTMHPFGDAVFDFLKNNNSNEYKSIILPSGYNIPVYFLNNHPIINFLSNIFRRKGKVSNQIIFQPETMSYHFYDKQSSLMKDNGFISRLIPTALIKSYLNFLYNINNKYYLTFRTNFAKNFPTKISYQTQPVIPEKIYIFKEESTILDADIKALEGKWKSLNPEFTVESVNVDEITAKYDLQSYSPDPQLNNKIALCYFLNQHGGIVVGSELTPANLKEFNYKYAYYGLFEKVNAVFEHLKIKQNFFAFAKGHIILDNLIKEINMSKPLNANIFDDIYLKNIYKYYQLDGKSIIFPEDYLNQKR